METTFPGKKEMTTGGRHEYIGRSPFRLERRETKKSGLRNPETLRASEKRLLYVGDMDREVRSFTHYPIAPRG